MKLTYVSRLCSLVLCLALAAGFTAPALAAGTGYEDFAADFDRYWAEDYWAGQDYSIEEFMEYFGYDTREELMEEVYESWLDSTAFARWEEEFRRDHAGEIAAFDPEAYWEEEYNSYGWYGSLEEFLEDCQWTDEEFQTWMLDQWLSDQWQAYRMAQERDRLIRGLGGTPGKINVMVNGSFLDFSDAWPEVVGGRTMVPLRPLMAALGAQVRVDSGQVVCRRGETTLSFQVGSDEVTVTEGGRTSTILMDCTSALRDGHTYVPLRFFAQALGLEAAWDAEYRAAVLMDRDAFLEQTDRRFTVLNRALDAFYGTVSTEDSLHTQGTVDAQITVLNSLNGDKSYNFSAASDVLAAYPGISGSLSLSMDQAVIDELVEDASLDAVTLAMLRLSLKKLELDYIMDLEEGRVWYRMPILSSLSYGLYDGGAWYTASAGTSAVGVSGATVGSLIWDGRGQGTPCSIFSWEELTDTADSFAQAFGDGRFTRSEGRDVMRYTLDDYREEDPSGAAMTKELQLELSVDGEGDAAFSLVLQAEPHAVSNFRLELSGSAAGGVLELSGSYHEANRYKVDLDVEVVQSPSRERPLSAPPEGDKVIDLEEAEEYLPQS